MGQVTMARKTGPPTVWKQAVKQFAIAYQDRFTNPSHSYARTQKG